MIKSTMTGSVKKKKKANQKGQTPKGIGRGPLNGDWIRHDSEPKI